MKYVRCRPYGVAEVSATRNLALSYDDDGGALVTREFDLVVLSIGIVAGEDRDGARRRPRGRARSPRLRAHRRLPPRGDLAPGRATPAARSPSPKDIPETVVQASAAACEAMDLLAPARRTLTTRQRVPARERRLRRGAAHRRLRLPLRHQHRRRRGRAGGARVREHAPERGLRGATTSTPARPDTQVQDQGQMIREHRLNRVVVASCTPRTHEPPLPRHLPRGGPQPVPLRDGEHPRPVLLGPHARAGAGHGEGQGPRPHGGGEGAPARAAPEPLRVGRARRPRDRRRHRPG